MALQFQGKTPIEAPRFTISIGLLFLRFCAVCTLVYYELALHLGKAWKNIWEEEPWGLLDQIESKGIPLPGAVSVALVLAAFLTSAGVLLGFLSRINAIILIVILGFLLIADVKTSPHLSPEAILLYIIIYIALAVTGAGKYSMDHLLTAQRNLRKA